jgi:hypothetical protein
VGIAPMAKIVTMTKKNIENGFKGKEKSSSLAKKTRIPIPNIIRK